MAPLAKLSGSTHYGYTCQVRLRPVPNPNPNLTRFDCGLFMTGTRGQLFGTHVIALIIQARCRIGSSRSGTSLLPILAYATHPPIQAYALWRSSEFEIEPQPGPNPNQIAWVVTLSAIMFQGLKVAGIFRVSEAR